MSRWLDHYNENKAAIYALAKQFCPELATAVIKHGTNPNELRAKLENIFQHVPDKKAKSWPGYRPLCELIDDTIEFDAVCRE